MKAARIVLFGLFLLVLATNAPAQSAGQEKIFRYGRVELSFTAGNDYADPLRDLQLTVDFTAPSGERQTARGFWDGGRQWKVRFSPDQAGEWKWISSSSEASEKNLVKSGSFRAWEYWGRNEIYRHGSPRVSPNHRFLMHLDGKPWLWLADTAWNGALFSTRPEWLQYVRDRAARKFTAVQFVMTQWRAGRTDERGQVAFDMAACPGSAASKAPAPAAADARRCLRVNPAYFQRMDEKFEVLNDEGLVAGSVLLWALTSEDNESPGVSLQTADAIALARYMVARYGAYQVVWFLGGDGDYRGANEARWKEIGRAVFPEGEPRRPVGLHPRGMQSPWAAYKDEPWLDVFFYQSGHGDSEAKWRWNATEGGAADWKMEPPHPVIDAEINYEGHLDYDSHQRIGAAQVRRAAYYSLLAAPPAGISYGAHGIWSWSRKAEVPLDHANTGPAQPWNQCLDYPGAQAMTVLHSVLSSVEWWKLRPDRSLLVTDPRRPAVLDYEHLPMPAMAEDKSFALIYIPNDLSVVIDLDQFEGRVDAIWIDPSSGRREVMLNWRPYGKREVTPPPGDDWVLLLRAPKSW